MNIQTAIKQVSAGINLDHDAMHTVMHEIMTGQVTDAQIGGLLVGLRAKGECVDEITAAAKVMRELSSKVNVDTSHLIDTCGTGGDGNNTFNISTTCAFVAAAAGAKVAKHGNRSVSSTCGSADVLEAAGVNLDLKPEQVAQCINDIGIGFMFAPMHHAAMKHAAKVRRELGMRTLFNVLGPLTNPAGAPNQLLGVFTHELLLPIAQVLQQLSSQHVLVVHSQDGLDEISIANSTDICELHNGEIQSYSIHPTDFGLQEQSIQSLQVTDANDSLAMMQDVLNNQEGAAKDVVILNAGAAIYTADVANSLEAGIKLATDMIENGAAATKLNELIKISQGF